jgi:glycosyltransferase involved in cell wall biosynthesis
MLAGLADGDATSHAALAMRDALRALGFASDLFALPESVDPSIRDQCKNARDYDATSHDVLIHHYGLWSDATDLFTASRAQKILLYHNVTPATFFRGFSDRMVQLAEHSRTALPALVAGCQALWAVSAYNAEELKSAGATDVHFFPLPFVKEPLDRPADAALLSRLRAPVKTILCVGRLAPNKCIEDLLEAFAWYHHSFNPYSRLLIVGSPRSAPKYFTYLRMLARDLHTPNICFEGFASPQGLIAYYELADVLVNVSQHEGYCLPLLEAMYKGVPVISRRAGGTPEAMGQAGVQFEELTPKELAALMHLTLTNASLRETILTSQQQRVDEALSRDLKTELHALLAHGI